MDENKAEESKKRNILFYVPHFPVLSETFIEREASKLMDSPNMNLIVVSSAAGTGALSENLVDQVHYEKITLGACFSAFFGYVLGSPKKVLDIHRLVNGSEGITDLVPYLISFNNDKSARTNQSFLGRFHKSRFVHFLKGLAFAKVLEKYEPDHIHCHFLSDISTIMMVAAKALGITFSVSAHAKDVFVEGTLIPIKAREAKFITVCNGNTWKEVVKQANLTKSSGKVKLMFHGIDSHKFFDVPLPKKPDKPFIFCIARLVEKKGLKYLIESSKILRDRGLDHCVKIVGAGPLYDELCTLVSDYGLENNVEILGAGKGLPNKEVAGWFQVADIYTAPFIVASDGDVDGVPTTVIEAALAKLPIVATDSGSMSDLVTPSTGVIVEQKSAEQLANAFEELIKDSEMRVILGNAAYEQAIKQFDLNNNVGELERLLLS